MLLPASLLAAVTALPVTEASPPGADAMRWSEGALTVAILERSASIARRRRRWRGSLGVGLGSVQVGLGAYALGSPRFDPVMRRTAFAQLLLGTATFGLGVYALAWPKPSERLWRSDELAAVVASPDDPAALRALRSRWAERAQRDRRV